MLLSSYPIDPVRLFRCDGRARVSSELKKELQRGVDHQLYLLENITPTVLTLLGGYCNVDPQFFLDYLDAILATQHNSKAC